MSGKLSRLSNTTNVFAWGDILVGGYCLTRATSLWFGLFKPLAVPETLQFAFAGLVLISLGLLMLLLAALANDAASRDVKPSDEDTRNSGEG